MSKEQNEEYVNFSIEISDEMKRDIDVLIAEDGFSDYDDFFVSLVQNYLNRRRGKLT